MQASTDFHVGMWAGMDVRKAEQETLNPDGATRGSAYATGTAAGWLAPALTSPFTKGAGNLAGQIITNNNHYHYFP